MQLRSIPGFRLAVAVGVLGALLTLLAPFAALEEQLGLGLLFSVRGGRPPPDNVEIIALSREAAQAYGLPANVAEWPRRLQAELIDRLSDAGAAAIVFDIAFERPRDPEGDADLAGAIRRSGRVVLLERVQASRLELPGSETAGRVVRQVPVLDEFRSAALGVAPFTLPTVPIRTSQFWVFGAVTPDGPMLPALAAQAYLLPEFDSFAALLDRAGALPADVPGDREVLLSRRGLEVPMQAIRHVFVETPGLGRDLLRQRDSGVGVGADSGRLPALIGLYAGPGNRYLNFYGPSGTIPTRPVETVVRPDAGAPNVDGLAGKVVFVGFADREVLAQQDDFVSVYAETTGQRLSGVEIGATAFANLVTNTAIVPVGRGAQALIVVAWGMLVVLVAAALPLAAAFGVVAGLAVVYLTGAVWSFDAFAAWVPLVVPLGLQVPLALGVETVARYRRVARQRERLRAALGPYAAPAIIDRLARDTANPHVGELVHGTCLVTDVAGYTTLAESVGPAVLATLMDEYFAILGRIIADQGGTVGDVSGDSMVGLWVAAGRTAETSGRAVAAAQAIEQRLAEFNRDRGHAPLVTAMGLETGDLALSRPSAMPSSWYRPVGDIVNTAARIQGLNRMLGTRMLMSAGVRADAHIESARSVGRFLLLGKRQVLEIWEAGPSVRAFAAGAVEFELGLKQFAAGDLAAATHSFESVLERCPNDGAAKFYADRAAFLAGQPLPAGWDGTVVMTAK